MKKGFEELTRLLSLYKEDYTAFVVEYKKVLEPKLLFLAESECKDFNISHHPRLEVGSGLNPPTLISHDDSDNSLEFAVDVFRHSLDELKAFKRIFKSEYCYWTINKHEAEV